MSYYATQTYPNCRCSPSINGTRSCELAPQLPCFRKFAVIAKARPIPRRSPYLLSSASRSVYPLFLNRVPGTYCCCYRGPNLPLSRTIGQLIASLPCEHDKTCLEQALRKNRTFSRKLASEVALTLKYILTVLAYTANHSFEAIKMYFLRYQRRWVRATIDKYTSRLPVSYRPCPSSWLC